MILRRRRGRVCWRGTAASIPSTSTPQSPPFPTPPPTEDKAAVAADWYVWPAVYLDGEVPVAIVRAMVSGESPRRMVLVIMGRRHVVDPKRPFDECHGGPLPIPTVGIVRVVGPLRTIPIRLMVIIICIHRLLRHTILPLPPTWERWRMVLLLTLPTCWAIVLVLWTFVFQNCWRMVGYMTSGVRSGSILPLMVSVVVAIIMAVVARRQCSTDSRPSNRGWKIWKTLLLPTTTMRRLPTTTVVLPQPPTRTITDS
mmetsp:Transcript_26917/g.49555  ORF Transcript_26917/g.49555 Transcript_26917/m.49555 type:complete len:255 (-) Transcript_26917:449-1213(-)